MNLESLGSQLALPDVAKLFDVAETTIMRHPARYGGVRFGRTVLFFDNLIADAIKEQYVLQRQDTPAPTRAAGADERAQASRAQEASGLPGPRRKRKPPVKAVDDPFDLLAS